MKQFLKTVLASMVGVFLSTILMFVFVLVLLVGMVAVMDSSSSTSGSAEKGTIIHLSLQEEILERTSDNPFGNFNPLSPSLDKGIGLDMILESLDKASRDPNVSGIYLDLPSVNAGMASMEE
ncbi:MAG: signal peptide peptidase SppA, partial [Bacteroidia bacterium]